VKRCLQGLLGKSSPKERTPEAATASTSPRQVQHHQASGKEGDGRVCQKSLRPARKEETAPSLKKKKRKRQGVTAGGLGEGPRLVFEERKKKQLSDEKGRNPSGVGRG